MVVVRRSDLLFFLVVFWDDQDYSLDQIKIDGYDCTVGISDKANSDVFSIADEGKPFK